MNNIIPFKKNIVFKTKIHDITDISLTHDYKVQEDMVEGDFFLSGTYKMTEASMINEEFFYKIPFSIAVSDRIIKESINLKLDDFKYSFKDDTVVLNIDVDMEYEEEESLETKEEMEQELIEEEENVELEERHFDDIIDDFNIEKEETELNEVHNEVNNVTINNLLSNVTSDNEYATYKVHIVRGEDTFESVAAKYNISLDLLKEYNKADDIKIGDKLVVPSIKNE